MTDTELPSVPTSSPAATVAAPALPELPGFIPEKFWDGTSGRVRLSSAINTGSAEQPHLVRRSLAEALGLDTSAGTWHLFRDHLEGCEYLRSGAELAGDGLHTPLNGYQARALVDWRRMLFHSMSITSRGDRARCRLPPN